MATREQWIELAGGRARAMEQEEAVLRIGREYLPPSAIAVLDDNRAEPSAEYWDFLIDSLEAS